MTAKAESSKQRPEYFPKKDRAPNAANANCRVWGHDVRIIPAENTDNGIRQVRCLWCNELK